MSLNSEEKDLSIFKDDDPNNNKTRKKSKTVFNILEDAFNSRSKKIQDDLVKLVKGKYIFVEGKLVQLDRENKKHIEILDKTYNFTIRDNGSIVNKNRSNASKKQMEKKKKKN